VTFKPEITLGQLVEVIVFVLGLIGIARKFGALEQKLNTLYTWWEKAVLYRHEPGNQERAKAERFVR
jgi:hypothetical protein